MTESGRSNIEYIEYNMSMGRLHDKISFAESVFKTDVCSEPSNTSSKTLHLQINDYRPSAGQHIEHESHSNDPQHGLYGMYITYTPSVKPFILSSYSSKRPLFPFRVCLYPSTLVSFSVHRGH